MEKTLKILVVDDDEVHRMTICRTLLEAVVDIELFEMNHRTLTISHLEAICYDCVFLNYRPDTDVISLIKQLRQYSTKAPLVAVTSVEDETAQQLLEAGATDYLQEANVSPVTIAIVLRNAIRLYRVQVQLESTVQQLFECNELLKGQNQELEAQRQQIELQNVKLSEVAQLKSQFLATISHEFRTPMNAIIGFSQFLLRPKSGQLSHSQRDMVERIVNNAKNLMTLLNEILDFSKLETGQLTLKPQIFDISKVINSTVTEMTSLAEAKNLSLQVKYQLQDLIIYNDPIRVKQIVTNLVSNAIKFTESGEVLVEITETSDRISIVVRDTGIGIDSEQLKNIFEVFRQVDRTTTRKYPGTGLGLAVVKAFLDMMGGTISVESKLGYGSKFIILLPRKIQSVKESQQKSTHAPFGRKHLPRQRDVFCFP